MIVATILLKLDKRLEAKRYELVPDLIEEEDFWRNYFFAIRQFKESQGIPEQEQLELEDDTPQVQQPAPAKTPPVKASSADIELQQLVSEGVTSAEQS